MAQAVSYKVLSERMLVFNAVRARLAGATWRQLAGALGVTEQAARKRFKALAEGETTSVP